MSENLTDTNKPKKTRALTSQEQSAIDRLRQRENRKPVNIFRTTDSGGTETLSLAIQENLISGEGIELLDAEIMSATGSAFADVGLQILTKLSSAIISGKTDRTKIANSMNIIAQSMQALAPQDEYEGQLVAQLIILHEHAMDWLGRAIRSERVDFANVYLNGASKLLTRHHETLDTLLKYRRRGEQRVHVEHVHVNEGGQAIVGNVTTGGGINQKFEEGPHAKV